MYGLDIPYGNCRGATFSRSGLSDEEMDERVRASAERSRRYVESRGGTVCKKNACVFLTNEEAL